MHVTETTLGTGVTRKSFGKIREVMQMPNLIQVQKDSYQWFLDVGLKEVLRDVPEDEFYAYMRGQTGPAANGSEEDLTDLQKSRAMHFFAENKRAGKLAEALKAGDFTRYLDLINQSARSSEELLKNIVPQSHPDSTQYAECIELARKTLGGKGAVRVHGGGFAGTIQAYVPLEEKDAFREKMESVLGKGTCHYLKISR